MPPPVVGRPLRRLRNLRRLREGRALSQAELAQLAGIGRSTIGALESQHQGGQPRVVRKLAEALGVTPDELYGE
jgi:transcriptional regulator with XRE-family HTH domain